MTPHHCYSSATVKTHPSQPLALGSACCFSDMTPADWLNFTPSRAAVHACVCVFTLGSLLYHGAYLNTEPRTVEKAVSGNQPRLVSTDVQPRRELKVREGGSVRSSLCPDYCLKGWRGSVLLPCWLTE